MALALMGVYTPNNLPTLAGNLLSVLEVVSFFFDKLIVLLRSFKCVLESSPQKQKEGKLTHTFFEHTVLQ